MALPLEAEQGHFRVLIVYLGGVIAGALGASIMQPDLMMVGASAGVYSLLISHLPHIAIVPFPNNWSNLINLTNFIFSRSNPEF